MKLFLLTLFLCGNYALYGARIGLCIMATGKYISYAEKLIESARIHFCKNHEVIYFMFTDGALPAVEDVVRIEQKRLGWPYDTMMRFHAYYAAQGLFKNLDYLFAVDADMVFVNTVGDEILGDLVATLHPGYIGTCGTPEVRKISTAYIKRKDRKQYFCGGFYGGKVQTLLEYWKTAIQNIDDDLKRGIIAVWHDESHWNKYLVEHKPTIVLSPSYCYVMAYKKRLPYVPRLVALDKNHEELRK